LTFRAAASIHNACLRREISFPRTAVDLYGNTDRSALDRSMVGSVLGDTHYCSRHLLTSVIDIGVGDGWMLRRCSAAYARERIRLNSITYFTQTYSTRRCTKRNTNTIFSPSVRLTPGTASSQRLHSARTLCIHYGQRLLEVDLLAQNSPQSRYPKYKIHDHPPSESSSVPPLGTFPGASAREDACFGERAVVGI
jgi:hypothetical protein